MLQQFWAQKILTDRELEENFIWFLPLAISLKSVLYFAITACSIRYLFRQTHRPECLTLCYTFYIKKTWQSMAAEFRDYHVGYLIPCYNGTIAPHCSCTLYFYFPGDLKPKYSGVSVQWIRLHANENTSNSVSRCLLVMVDVFFFWMFY